jgi:vacuolar protein sorting-associated protein 35
MAVFDALRHLSIFLRDSHPVNHLADLYELVQYAGNIVPRLYLMITVGTVYMAIEDAPVKEIMKDMMEMSRGVQHPVRGLFLRYYLVGQARDHLPTGRGDGPEGNLQDSINFIITNFVEMNKLWVRLQHQGHSREREQRTKERQELQLLVGSNLVRLSQIVDLEHYRRVLPPLLVQVVECRDALAQEYLLEGGHISHANLLVLTDGSTPVITQVFPDEYHLFTLDLFLSSIGRLNPHVNVKNIVIGLMDRLSAYATREAEALSDEQRRRAEEEATVRLLEGIRISKEEDTKKQQQHNGDINPNIDRPFSAAPSEATTVVGESAIRSGSAAPSEALSEAPTLTDNASLGAYNTAITNRDVTESHGIPESVKLFEIFYEQVVNLVKMQRLPIQDTIALLVSLINLAL